MDLPKTQAEYIKRIKTELNNALTNSKYNITQLQELLEERYDFRINKGTLRELFNTNNPNINYACLITTCQFFGFDLNTFLKTEDANPSEDKNVSVNTSPKFKRARSIGPHPFMESLKAVDSKFTVLRDDGYMGDFKGYIVTPSKSDHIDEFHLSLYKDSDNIARARLYRYSMSKKKTDYFEYTGIPYHSKAYQSILLFLTDTNAKGEFYFLSFGFQEYRSAEGLMFRQGLAVTGESLRSGNMVAQNFLLFSSEISPEKQKYIPGLLKTPVNEFCVPVKVAEKLANDHPEVKALLEKLNTTLNHSAESLYIFNEDNILSLNRMGLTPYDRIKALLLLKGEAIVPDKNYYLADSKFSGFVLNYLLEK